jgi:arsenate reductase
LSGSNHQTVRLYGLANCDTVRKARRWLSDHQVEVSFVDFKKQPPDRELISQWLKHLPYDSLLNTRGTTWRKLEEAVRKSIVDQASAVELMLTQPSVIKRPVLEWSDQLAVGFSDSLYQGFFT